jgi:hypothetical protein
VIVIDSSAAGDASDDGDPALGDDVGIDLFYCILVAADDDRRRVDIEEDAVFVSELLAEDIFFEREVDACVRDSLVVYE